MGSLRLLQRRLVEQGLANRTVDRVIHSARGMLRDASLAGYGVADLKQLCDRALLRRLDDGSTRVIDPFTDHERDRILAHFASTLSHHHAFVLFRFWTGTRPSEAIALRWESVDLDRRTIEIRRSRVLNRDGRPKTGRSRRRIVIHDALVAVLDAHRPADAQPEDFVFTERATEIEPATSSLGSCCSSARSVTR